MTLRTIPRTALLALLLAAPSAFAAPPSDAQVDRLMELTRARSTLEAMWPQLEMMQQDIADQMLAESGQPLDDEQRARLDALLDRQMRSIRTAMAWERLEPVYRDIYQQTFEAEDVAAMIGFYESEAGQKLIAKTPQLMQNTMQATQRLLAPLLEEMQHDIRAVAGGAAHEGDADLGD